MSKSSPSHAPLILNIPELLSTPLRWEEVKGIFLKGQANPAIQTLLRLLVTQMATARRYHEGDPSAGAGVRDWNSGAAHVANETCGWILQLMRGEADKLPGEVKKLLGWVAEEKGKQS